MLKEFWEEKKHILQVGGALTTIGALFLTIPKNEDEIAQQALQNIQFFWLIIIVVSITIILAQLLVFLFSFEATTKNIHNIDFDNAFSAGFLLFSLFFLFYLIKYIFVVYNTSIEQVNFIIYPLLGSIIGAGYVFFERKSFIQRLHFIIRDLLFALIAAIIIGIYHSLRLPKFEFDLRFMAILTLAGYLLGCIFRVNEYFKNKRKIKVELDKISN